MSMPSAAFSYQSTPANANDGNKLHELDFPLRIIPFEGDWYDAASIYRDWVLPNAEWT